MSKSKKITLIVLWTIFSLITLSVGLFFSGVQAQSDGTHISFTPELTNDIKVSSYKQKLKNDGSSTNLEKTNIENGSYVLLENLSGAMGEKYGIFFSIDRNIDSKKYIINLQANAYLNGEQISLTGKTSSQPTELVEYNPTLVAESLLFEISSRNTLTYLHKYDENNEPMVVDNLQGHYEIYFKASICDINENKTYSIPADYDWYKYEFTIIDKDQYHKENQFPTFANIESADENIYFNNYSYENKDGYATLTFDAERYKLKINRLYEGKTTKIESSFAYFTDSTYQTESKEQTNYGKLFFNYPDKIISFNLQRNEKGLFIFDESKFSYNTSNTTNFIQPLFYDLGEYSLQYYYQIYENGNLLYDETPNSPVSITPKKLYVFGFNLNYAHNVTSSKYFVSFTQNQNTDFTNKLNLDWSSDDFIIPSTNQAPVWFNSMAELTSTGSTTSTISYFYANSLSALEKMAEKDGKYTLANLKENAKDELITASKSTYFTEAGYYVVFCDNYSYSSLSNRSQVFLFQIKNSTPKATIKALTQKDGITNESDLPSGGFTNGDVYIYMDKLGIFDSPITTQYSINTNYGSSFSNYTNFQIKEGADSFQYTTFSTPGKYSIKIMFGIKSVSYYTFTIDKTDIKDFVHAYTVSSISSSADSNYVTKKDITTSTVTNSPFTVLIEEKPSKSPITATLITIDIETNQNYTQTEVYYPNNEENRTFVYSRYIATYASSPSEYTNIISTPSSYISANFVFSQHKIYIFQITDASGFSYVHIVYLDKSNANLLQYDKDGNITDITDFNIVSSKTNVKWAKNKALEFVDRNTLPPSSSERNLYAMSLLQDNSDYFAYNGTTFSMLIPITNVNITSTDLNSGTTPGVSGDLYSEMNKSTELTIYGMNSEAPENTHAKFIGEKIYTIKLTDESGNITEYSIEVNMDRSLGKMFTTNQFTGDKYRTNKLALEQAGSLDFLIFEWKDEESGAFKIESLTYEFYPLTYDKNSKYYPYAETPTKTGDLLAGKVFTNSEGLSYSEAINSVTISYYEYDEVTGQQILRQKNVSEAGRYVVKRTYTGSGSEITDVGDTKERTYMFYVDRNPILDYPNSNLETGELELGSGIKFYFGKEKIAFDEFYRQYQNHIIIKDNENKQSTMYLTLESNLLPISIKVPKNKYSYLNGTTLVNNPNAPSTYDLEVVLEKYTSLGVMADGYPIKLNQNSSIKPDVDSSGYITVPDITTSGYYRIMIQDKALTSNNQISPMNENKYYFGFYVNLSSPEGQLISSDTKATIAGEAPLSLSINDNQFIYSVDTNIVSSVQVSSRILSNKNPNNSTPFEYYATYENTSEFQLTIKNDDSTTYQYKLEIIYKDSNIPNSIQYSPLYSDYDNYRELLNGDASKDNFIAFTFSEPNDSYMASIDTSDIQITKSEKVNGVYSNPTLLVQGQDFIIQQRLNPENNKIFYSVLVYQVDNENPIKEYKFDLKYHFIGDESYFTTTENGNTISYFSSSQTIYVDKTAPTYNLNKLANLPANTSFLTKINKSAYESHYYQETSGTYYYANVSDFDYAIGKDFTFTLPTNSSGQLDTQEGSQIYFRKYSKYDESKYNQENKNQAYQSLVPGDPEYNSGTSAKLRFSATNNTLWTMFSYNSGTFYEQVKQLTGSSDADDLSGYYEIIEIDSVGNHSIYTVLLDTTIQKVIFDANTQTGPNQIVATSANNVVSSFNTLYLNKVEMLDNWFTITLDKKEFVFTPSSNVPALIEEINAIINSGSSSYSMTLSNRFGTNLTLSLYISSSGKTLGIKNVSSTPNNEGYFEVVFDEDLKEDGIFMQSLKAYKFDEELKMFVEMINENNEPIDSTGQVIVVKQGEPNSKRTFYFDSGIYKFFIEDNFRQGENAIEIVKNINVNIDNYEFIYSADTINYNGKTYTTDNVTLDKINSSLYQVTATRNGEAISNITYPTFVFTAPNESPNANVLSGGSYEYKVNIFDVTTGETYNYEFVIYNVFPAIMSENSKGESMDKIMATRPENVSTFTSDSILLYWSTSGLPFGYTFELFQYENLASKPINSKVITGGGVNIVEKGAYELKITNKILKNTRSIWFVIRENDMSMYSVNERLPDGTINNLSPADVLLNASSYKNKIIEILNKYGKEFSYNSNMMIKNFFSIYDFEINVDGDKGLSTNWGKADEEIIYTYASEIGTKFTTKIVIVFGISPYNYLDIFAVTKIQPNSRFLETISYTYTGLINPEPPVEETDENAGEEGGDTEEPVYGDIEVPVETASFSNISIYENPITLKWASYYGVPQNKIFMSYYYNGKFIATITSNDAEYTTLKLVDDGEYKFYFRDLAGNKMVFGDNSAEDFTIIIKSKVQASINNELPIYGAVYNNDVNFAINNPTDYTTLTVEVYKNGILEKIEITKNQPTYTFKEQGFYRVVVNGALRTSNSTIKQLQTNEIIFTIINPNESKFAYEFSSINGYEIIQVSRNGYDITEELRQDNAGIYSLVLSEQVNGIGKYHITILANFTNSLQESKEFSFDVWINNKTPILDCNVPKNSISVDTIVITYNPKSLYEQLGDCKIVVGKDTYNITSSSLNDTENKTIQITTAGTYYVTLLTASGNVISMYKVTKQDPLNTLSIILIVVSVIVVIGGSYLFFRLRVKMKVK